jgi:hypothetical protein
VRRANAAASQARSAFRRRIPVLHGSCWRLSRDLEGRHWCFGLAASAQLPTRIHAQALRARPLPLAGFRRSSGTPCRSSTSAMVVIHEHDPRSSRPRRCCDGEPPHDEQHLLPKETAPAGCPQPRGLGPRRTLDPHLDVRTPKRIYPDLLGPDTSCRSLTPSAAWKQATKSDRTEHGPPCEEQRASDPRAEAR